MTYKTRGRSIAEVIIVSLENQVDVHGQSRIMSLSLRKFHN